MALLDEDQKARFRRDGVLVVEDAVDAPTLERLRAVFAGWVEESRRHDGDYGETLDGRARFDVQPGHTADRPALRRVQSPEEVSEAFADTMRTARTVDCCAELLGTGFERLRADGATAEAFTFKRPFAAPGTTASEEAGGSGFEDPCPAS